MQTEFVCYHANSTRLAFHYFPTYLSNNNNSLQSIYQAINPNNFFSKIPSGRHPQIPNSPYFSHGIHLGLHPHHYKKTTPLFIGSSTKNVTTGKPSHYP